MRWREMRWLVSLSLGVLLMLAEENDVAAQIKYQKPPQAVREVLDAPPPPSLLLDPTRRQALLLQGERYPPIADLAAPMLKLAGYRIDPATNGPHGEPRIVGLSILDLATGNMKALELPKGLNVGHVTWSPLGGRFAFTCTTPGGIELWLGDASRATVERLQGVQINAAYGEPLQWLPRGEGLLCQLIPKDRGQPPVAPPVPAGPTVQESAGKPGPVRTYQDLLRNPHDEDLFDYYATSQLARVTWRPLQVQLIGQPGLLRSIDPSPDGKRLLVVRNVRPYSYLHPGSAFPREIEVWDLQGNVVHKVASLPLADKVPIEGVPTGARFVHWRPQEPATLAWVEALDDGDPRKKVPHRDALHMASVPFKEPRQVHRLEHRFAGISYVDDGSFFLREYDRDRKWQRTFRLQGKQHPEPQLVFDLSVHDRYGDPGRFAYRTLPSGERLVRTHEEQVFLLGDGATPQGDRPFLAALDLKSMKTRRLYQSAEDGYEAVAALLTDDGSSFLTRYESPVEPPNFFIHTGSSKRKLTNFKDPTPQLRQIRKELVTYKRPDGVQLSFTLYLPPGYKPGERLPAVVWAYPREYVDAATAGQVSGSTQRFTSITGPSHLFFLLQGYAILDGATIPVVGDPETVNNTYIEQIVSSAKAAIDKADEMGVIDRNRVGVGGHSYGAFMTANLLAHSNLFRAGIARSGAYNRTLTPFGFQSERRTLWEAPQVYLQMSPFMHAHKIKTPILLIHGEADNNPGTFPMQSERLYHAIRGTGGVVRYVTLPYESHGYAARESVEHCLYEMLAWFDRHVQNAK